MYNFIDKLFVFIMCSGTPNDDAQTQQNPRTISLFEEGVMGRRIAKSFAGYADKFFGTVTDVDDNEDPNGQRLFKCEYDDGDIEWLPRDDMVAILVPVHSSSEMPAQQEPEHKEPEPESQTPQVRFYQLVIYFCYLLHVFAFTAQEKKGPIRRLCFSS